MKRVLWIFLGFGFMGFDVFSLSMEQFSFVAAYVKRAVEFASGVYWSLDVCLSFATGIFVNAQLELRFRQIARQYILTWCIFDISLVALQWVSFQNENETSHTNLVRYVRIARYARLLRFIKFDQLLSSILERVNSVSLILLLQVGKYLSGIVLWVHTSGCAWYAIGRSTENGWAMTYESVTPWPVNYLLSMNWASSQLQGNIDVYPGMVARERGFAVCHSLCSVIVLGLFISKLTTLMQTMEDVSAQMSRQASAAQQYCMQHRISTPLSVRVRRWLEWHEVLEAKRHRSVQEDEFMQVLPADLRRALLDEARSPLLVQHELFHAIRECNIRFFQRLACDTFIPFTYMPEETIFSYGMVCTRMYVIAAGDSSYMRYGTVLRALMQSGTIIRGHAAGTEVKDGYKKIHSEQLQEGASLCESVLWIHWVHIGDFATITRMSVLVLEMMRFEDLVYSYPQVHTSLRQHAQRFLAAIRAAKDPSDLFNTNRALQLE